MHAHLTAISRNAKTGPIPVSTTSADTCPPTCALRDSGCYADGGPLRLHWDKVTRRERGTDWGAFVKKIERLYPTQLWRHNQAGDLPNDDGAIDAAAFGQLVDANERAQARGFTYTHCPPTSDNLELIRDANRRGFTVNLSADTFAELDRLPPDVPAVVLLPLDAPMRAGAAQTPGGRRVIQCPAERSPTVTCRDCALCYRADRRTVAVGFTVHGARKSAADLIARG